MRIITSPGTMQRLAQKWLRSATRIGLVPTMGCLHPGHLSLVACARQGVGSGGVVVVSIYVNPTQFGPHEDFSKYPRTLPQDLRLCRQSGVDVVFAPDDAQMYPGRAAGQFSTYVVEEQLSRGMEGASRPTHFRGVTTVVAKLFHCVRPDVAVFGEKDFQQAAVLERMTRDLNFPVVVKVAPTLREPDGLALSSRNQYLDSVQRAQATILYRTLQRARAAVRRGSQPAARLKADLRQFIATQSRGRLDYLECFDPATLTPSVRVSRGTRLALAVYFGPTRLIDNGRL